MMLLLLIMLVLLQARLATTLDKQHSQMHEAIRESPPQQNVCNPALVTTGPPQKSVRAAPGVAGTAVLHQRGLGDA